MIDQSLFGIAIVPCGHLEEIKRDTVRRPWWQRCVAWLWRPWQKAIVIETRPWYQIGGTIYAHPNNIQRLRGQLQVELAEKETSP